MTFKLNSQLRKDTKRSGLFDLRKQGLVPVVVYGRGFKNIELAVNYVELAKIWGNAGESSLIEMVIEGQKDTYNVLIKDIQTDPITDKIIHVDFQHIRMDEEVTAEVKLNFVNEAPAVKELGGNLVISRDHIKIRCLPEDLIATIDVDLSGLVDYDKSITVKDLGITDKVKVMDDSELTLASVIPPKLEKVEEVIPAAGLEPQPTEGEAAPATEKTDQAATK